MIRETEGWGRLSEEWRGKGKERWIEKLLKGGKECEKKMREKGRVKRMEKNNK